LSTLCKDRVNYHGHMITLDFSTTPEQFPRHSKLHLFILIRQKIHLDKRMSIQDEFQNNTRPFL
jgi:hypothetical protein